MSSASPGAPPPGSTEPKDPELLVLRVAIDTMARQKNTAMFIDFGWGNRPMSRRSWQLRQLLWQVQVRGAAVGAGGLLRCQSHLAREMCSCFTVFHAHPSLKRGLLSWFFWMTGKILKKFFSPFFSFLFLLLSTSFFSCWEQEGDTTRQGEETSFFSSSSSSCSCQLSSFWRWVVVGAGAGEVEVVVVVVAWRKREEEEAVIQLIESVRRRSREKRKKNCRRETFFVFYPLLLFFPLGFFFSLFPEVEFVTSMQVLTMSKCCLSN